MAVLYSNLTAIVISLISLVIGHDSLYKFCVYNLVALPEFQLYMLWTLIVLYITADSISLPQLAHDFSA